MDLRKRFGDKDVHIDKRNRILVVELENKLLGLIVSSASEVLKIPLRKSKRREPSSPRVNPAMSPASAN